MNARVISSEIRTARKDHKCALCALYIYKSERYTAAVCVGESAPYTQKMHRSCDILMNHAIGFDESVQTYYECVNVLAERGVDADEVMKPYWPSAHRRHKELLQREYK